MQNAPDEREDEPEPTPTASTPKKNEAPAPETKAPTPPDDFHKDPLIQDAVEIFKGKLKS